MPNSLTLRKAAKYRNRLEGRLKEIRALIGDSKTAVNIFDPNIPDQIVAAQNRLDANVARFQATSAALLKLRTQIGTTNAAAGINDLLAEHASVTGQLAAFRNLSNVVDIALAPDVLKARVDGLKAKEDRYGQDAIGVDFLSQKHVDEARGYVQAATTRLDEIQDALEQKNGTTFDVADSIMAVLQNERLI